MITALIGDILILPASALVLSSMTKIRLHNE
jgi:hypothetical protein